MGIAAVRGDDYRTASANLAKRLNADKSNAARLVMTESAFMAEAARNECMKDLGCEEYQVVATLDRKTSPICRNMDGKHFPIAQFKPGTTAPPFHCWCRSCTAPYFDNEAEYGGVRVARDESGDTYHVPATMTYKEWVKSRLNKSGTLPAVQNNDKIKLNINWSLPKLTRREVERFAFDTDSGQPVERAAVVYRGNGGAEFAILRDINTAKQPLTIKQLSSVYYTVRNNIRRIANKQFEVVDWPSPYDDYFRKPFKKFTTAFATTGDNKIVFYKSDAAKSNEAIYQTIIHELGHSIDNNLATLGVPFSKSKIWIEAMNKDFVVSNLKSPSEYGENNSAEDFAEALSWDELFPEEFRRVFPNRARIIDKILG